MRNTLQEYYHGLEQASQALIATDSDPQHRAQAVHALLNDSPSDSACQKACAHCCHFPVGVRFGEALLLAEAIADDPTLRMRLAREADATADAAWNDLTGRRCPLLHNEHCARYESRPTPCRALHSRDADACARSLSDPVAVPRDESAWWRGLGTAAAIDERCGARELRSAVHAILALADRSDLESAATAFANARGVPGT